MVKKIICTAICARTLLFSASTCHSMNYSFFKQAVEIKKSQFMPTRYHFPNQKITIYDDLLHNKEMTKNLIIVKANTSDENQTYSSIKNSRYTYNIKLNNGEEISCYKSNSGVIDCLLFSNQQLNFSTFKTSLQKLTKEIGITYDKVLLSNPNLPDDIKYLLKKELYSSYVAAEKITDQEINQSTLSESKKQQLITYLETLNNTIMDPNNTPLEIFEEKTVQAIQYLKAETITAVIATMGTDNSYSNLITNEQKSIINSILKDQGFSQEMYFTRDHVLKKWHEKNFSFYVPLRKLAKKKSAFFDPNSPFYEEKLKKKTLHRNLIENNANRVVMAQPLHSLKNSLDKILFSKIKKSITIKNSVNSRIIKVQKEYNAYLVWVEKDPNLQQFMSNETKTLITRYKKEKNSKIFNQQSRYAFPRSLKLFEPRL